MNGLIKQGATPVTSSEDVLTALGFEIKTETTDKKESNISIENLSPNEQVLVKVLKNGEKSRDELMNETELKIQDLNTTLMTLEIKNLISEQQGKIFLNF